jgi:hypothetical protein
MESSNPIPLPKFSDPLLCDGGYLYHYALKSARWAHLPEFQRILGCARWLATAYPQAKLWALDSPQQAHYPQLTPLLADLGYTVYMYEGYRADDIIASTLSKLSSAVVISTDKDIQAFASPTVSFLSHLPGWNKLHTDTEIAAKWGLVTPSQIWDVLAWTGDDVDHVDGIPGVTLATAKAFALQGRLLDRIDLDTPPEWLAYEDHFNLLTQNYFKIKPKTGLDIDFP